MTLFPLLFRLLECCSDMLDLQLGKKKLADQTTGFHRLQLTTKKTQADQITKYRFTIDKNRQMKILGTNLPLSRTGRSNYWGQVYLWQKWQIKILCTDVQLMNIGRSDY